MNDKLIERLQAYFDGELTAEERLRVEAVIAESAECRGLLKHWEQQRRSLRLLKDSGKNDEGFVRGVMNRLEELKRPEPQPLEMPDFMRWLFPALGYALSCMLVFLTFSVKPPSVSADTILLRQVPQETRGVYIKNASDISQIFLVEER